MDEGLCQDRTNKVPAAPQPPTGLMLGILVFDACLHFILYNRFELDGANHYSGSKAAKKNTKNLYLKTLYLIVIKTAKAYICKLL